MFLGLVFYGSLGKTRIIARYFWALIGFMILHFPVYMTMLLLVPNMPVRFWVRPYLVLSINFLAVISPFVNDLFVISILWKGLDTAWVLFWFVARFLSLFFFSLSSLPLFFVDSSIAWICQARSCHLHLLKDCACVNGLFSSRRGLLTWLVFIQGIFVALLASLVTYIRQSGILSLSHFLVTYIHLRNLVTWASSMIYIHLGGILSPIFYMPYIRWRDRQ